MKRKIWLSCGIAASVGAFLPLLPAPARADWPVQYGNSSFNRGTSVATDSMGNVFTGGYTGGDLFGESSLGYDDGYVAKFDSSGTLQWGHLFGTSAFDIIHGVAAVGAGSMAAAGITSGSLPGYPPGYPGEGSFDALVRLYDATGATAWTRQFGTDDFDYTQAIAADGAGHLYVGGYTGGSFGGFTTAGGRDLFVAQLDAATGAVNWTFQLGSSVDDYGMGLAADSAGNVYLGGYTYGSLPGQTNAGDSDAFVLKLNVNGTLQWTRQFGTAGIDEVRGVAVDSTGAVLVAGRTDGTLGGQASAGGADAFVQKWDANGNLLWTRQFGTTGTDMALGVAADGADQAIVGGYTTGALPGETNTGGADAFVQVFSPSGSVNFTDQIGSSGSDIVHGVATDTLGHAYLAGETFGTLPGQTSAGGNDAFLIQTAVPEPTTAALLALGLLALPRRRRAR